MHTTQCHESLKIMDGAPRKAQVRPNFPLMSFIHSTVTLFYNTVISLFKFFCFPFDSLFLHMYLVSSTQIKMPRFTHWPNFKITNWMAVFSLWTWFFLFFFFLWSRPRTQIITRTVQDIKHTWGWRIAVIDAEPSCSTHAKLRQTWSRQ